MKPVQQTFWVRYDAEFSPCRIWRYRLRRIWEPEQPALNVIGLNPSKADERIDDNTIRRCMNYARAWGYGGLVMTNLFPYRATNPREMKAVENPLGDAAEADRAIVEAAQVFELDGVRTVTGLVLAAWGNDGEHHGRAAHVLSLLKPIVNVH